MTCGLKSCQILPLDPFKNWCIISIANCLNWTNFVQECPGLYIGVNTLCLDHETSHKNNVIKDTCYIHDLQLDMTHFEVCTGGGGSYKKCSSQRVNRNLKWALLCGTNHSKSYPYTLATVLFVGAAPGVCNRLDF